MPRFKKVYIEITNNCNLACDFCPNTQRDKQFMDAPSFLRVIEAIQPLTGHVYFHLMGEPFLHPKLKEFLEICRQKTMKVNITTNGTLIKKVEDVLLNAPALRKVGFSLHSVGGSSEGSSEGINDYIDDIVEFIKKVNGTRIIELRLWNLVDEVESKCETKNERDSEIAINHLIMGRLERRLGISLAGQHESAKILPNVYLSFANKFDWPDLSKTTENETAFCYGLRDQFGVLVDGTVVPCCVDNEGQISLGNIFEHSIEDILSSERAQRIFEGFSNRTPFEELCKKCDFVKGAKRIRKS